MLEATSTYGDNRILVIDRSPEVETDFENVIRNGHGEGFLAGRMRNLGTAWLRENRTITGIVYFDGDRIPNATPTEFERDVVLYSGEKDDARKEIAGDVTEFCKHPYSPFYSAGFYLSAKALEALDWTPFDSAFDGYWGWEDSYLGDRLVSLGFKVELPKELVVTGELCEPDWLNDAQPSDARLRNWYVRQDKRKTLQGIIMQEAQNQVVTMPVASFNEVVALLVSLPYKDSAKVIDLLNKTAYTHGHHEGERNG
jgi:hypothetical protein